MTGSTPKSAPAATIFRHVLTAAYQAQSESKPATTEISPAADEAVEEAVEKTDETADETADVTADETAASPDTDHCAITTCTNCLRSSTNTGTIARLPNTKFMMMKKNPPMRFWTPC